MGLVVLNLQVLLLTLLKKNGNAIMANFLESRSILNNRFRKKYYTKILIYFTVRAS